MWAGGFSCLAAVLSVIALMLVFPVVKLLFEGQDFREFVAAEQRTARDAVATLETGCRVLDEKIRQAHSEGLNPQVLSLKGEQQRTASKLKVAIQWQSRIDWMDKTFLPWLPSDSFNLLALIMGSLFAVTVAKCAASCLVDVLTGSVTQRAMQSLRQQLLRRTLKLDQQTLALETTPGLMARFTFDLAQVSNGVSLFGSSLVLDPLRVLFSVCLALHVNWRLTIIAMAGAPMIVLLFHKLGRRVKRASHGQMESMTRVYRLLDETLQSFRNVLAFRNEGLHRRKLSVEQREYFQKAQQIVKIDAISSPAIEFLAMVAVCAATLPGAYLVLRHQTSILGLQLASHEMSVADLALLYALLAGVLDPARKLSGVFSRMKKAAASCDRIFGWMDRPSLLAAEDSPIRLPRHGHDIVFDQVTFRYSSLDKAAMRPPALDGVSVRIPFGAAVAVVGGNGSGKSTLVNLLPRFFDPQMGVVRIDGTDLLRANLSLLRSQIGIVTQETQLFDRSIADNIAYGMESASREDVEFAAKRARVIEFARQMPDGLDTHVGDRGHRLSGGQRQRVALARALLRSPAVLILDEATSAVDAHSEHLIHEVLQELVGTCTILIVTHAMTATLVNCLSHVLVMEHGRVIAYGPHDIVLATSPAYQRLYQAQTRAA